MIDFAGDLGRIFADPQGFGVDATYTPAAGPPVSVRVVPARPDETARFGEMRLAAETAEFLIPVAEVASPSSGDTLTYDGTDYTVQGQPERDERRVMWRVETRPAS